MPETPKSNAKLVKEIQEGMGKLLPLIELCRLPEGFFSVPESMESVPRSYLEEATNWIRTILSTTFADWRTIRKQQSEERWNWILHLDPDTYAGFREVVLHKEALKAARKSLFTKHRPDLFQKKHHERIMKESQDGQG